MAQSRSTQDTAKKKNSGTRTQTQSRAKRSAGTSVKKSAATTKSSAAGKQQPATEKKGSTTYNMINQREQSNQLWSLLLFAISILVLLMSVIPASRGWGWMHNHLRGWFGIGVFAIPIILVATSVLIGQNHNQKASRLTMLGIALTIGFCAFIQVFFGETAWDEGFKTTIQNLFNEGALLHGGGVLSGVLAWPLVAMFSEIGARIFILLIIFVLIMLWTNKTVLELFQLCCKPFLWLWHGIEHLATRGIDFYEDSRFMDDADDEEPFRSETDAWDDDALEDENDDAEEITFFPRLPRKPSFLRRLEKQPEILADGNDLPDFSNMFDSIDVDVPIPAAESTAASAKPLRTANTASTNAKHANQAISLDDEVQRMIADAAGSPAPTREIPPWDAPDDTPSPDDGVYEEEQVISYIAPPLTLLQHIDNTANNLEKEMELREKSQRLVETLASFGVEVRIVGMRRGPSVTRYEIQPAAGVKISKITALADDIGMNLGGEKVRIEAPIPGKPAVGVEVANNTKDMVPIRDILESVEFRESRSKLTFAVGKDIDGNVILGDIAKMPHMIIAGTTGSGKSVCTNSIIMSVLFHASPEEVRMVLIDPKVVEFAPYEGIPHLLIPVVTNPQKAAGALNWAVIEMERRYGLCAQYGVRDLKGYNALAERNPELQKLPQILIIIDEFADLMMSASKEVETAVIRIAQKARAAGIHLIIATQRPTVDVITGLIKANVPSRIGMSVKSAQDSRIILDCSGAETLLGNGDLLFYPNGWREPKRVQGCFCSDTEVEAVTSFLKHNSRAEYDAEIIEAVEQNVPSPKGEKPSGIDDNTEATSDEELLIRAAEYAVDAGQLSTTALQRRLKLGYARAARIVDELESRGIVGPSEGARPRKVHMTPQELTEWKLRIAAKGGTFEE